MVYNFPSSSAVMTSLSRAMIGDDIPVGARTFHFTFLSGPNSTGGFWPAATPDPPGPRNCGHASGVSPPCPTAARRAATTNAIGVLMSNTSGVVGMVSSSEWDYHRPEKGTG